MTDHNNIFNQLDHQYLIFENKKISTIIDIDDNLWFDAKEAAIALGYKDPKQIIKKYVSRSDKINFYKIKINYEHHVKRPQTLYLNETGLYHLILKSKIAIKFKEWLTHDVLPAIRKYGIYKHIKETENLLNTINQKIKFLENENKKLKSLLKTEKYPKGPQSLPKGGHIYVIEHDKNIYKIGMTNDLNKCNKSYNTHNLYNKKIIYYTESSCPRQLKLCVFSHLYKYRYTNKKNFFQCELSTIIKCITKCKKNIECIDDLENETNETNETNKKNIIKNIIRLERKKYKKYNRKLKMLNRML